MDLFPNGLHGSDRLSQPILIYRVGKVDGAALMSKFDEGTRVKCHAQMMEFVLKVVFPASSVKAGKRVDRLVTIYDLAGVSFSSLSNFNALFTPLIKSQAAHYPDTNFKMLFVNAPFGIQSVCKVIILTDYTRFHRLTLVDLDLAVCNVPNSTSGSREDCFLRSWLY